MKKLIPVFLLFFVFASPAKAGLHVGASVDVLNFFVLPGGTGLSTETNFGLGSVYGGYSLGKSVALRGVLAYDNTGTITGNGNLYGQSFTASGKFKVFTFSAELFLHPPFFPLYLKAGAGLGSLTSEGFPSPFDQLKMKASFHGGTGISFSVASLQIHAGIDVVYILVDSGSTGLNVSGIPFFRTLVGATYHL